jgi:aryl-alcohol dehydrogenase-like predicted oxidoreductase
MEYRLLGHSGLKASVLSLGTITFGGKGNFAKTGSKDLSGARRQIELCLDAGVNLFDTADVYSAGLSEEILDQALEGRRDVLIATKAGVGNSPNNVGTSRLHLIEALEASLKRLRTDRVLYQLYEWDGKTPLEETLETLDTLVRSGARSAISAYPTSPAGIS